MSPKSCSCADAFLHVSPADGAASRNVIFFIPGNPGLLGYYNEFLALLSTSPLKSTCNIAGFSLGGFDVGSGSPLLELDSDVAMIQYPGDSPRGLIFSLQDQVELTYQRIGVLVQRLRDEGNKGQGPWNVVLVGHSVGAYIALEVIRRLHELRDEGQEQRYTIAGAILLTPTVVDIAKSRHGRVVTPLLSCAPGLEKLAQWAVWGLARVVSDRILEGLVGRVTGMKGEKLGTTLNWLRSEQGVRQMISMGGQEMQEIREENWGEEIWGGVDDATEVGEEDETEGEKWKIPKLVLYFAKQDHWVEDTTREAIIEVRGQVKGKEAKAWPRIEIEESGRLVHGWCIEQSAEVAERVRKWIEEMLA